LKVATSDRADNGFIKLYINNKLRVDKRFIDNDLLEVKVARIGIIRDIPPAFNISGKLFLDHFALDALKHISK
jgi:hypothetical protein